MLGRTKTAHLLVLCLLLNVLSFETSADEAPTEPKIQFHQADGIHALSILNLSGDSTVSLTSVEITVWNISQPDQWSLLTTSLFFDSVVPYTDSETDKTMWEWEHSFDLDTIDCTCYIEISLLERTDLISFGLIVYIGDEHHRPVLMNGLDTDANQFYSTQIYNDNLIYLSYHFLLPPSQTDSVEVGDFVLSNVRICNAPNGICLGSFTNIGSTDFVLDNDISLQIDADEQSIQDGYYLLQVQIQDVYLTLSNNITQFVIIDQSKPVVNLSAVDEVNEAQPIVVDIDVDDGYIGSSFVITWSITEPNGTPRAVLESEILEDSRLEFIPTKAGEYRVNALVRDTGGHLVTVYHNISVVNVAPTLDVRYDGFLIDDGSFITVPSSGDWTFTANASMDTTNDRDNLQYTLYVDGKTLLSGKSYLSSGDLQQTKYREIMVQITDDDGQSAELTFQVDQQQELASDSITESTITSTITILFISLIGLFVYRRQRNQSESNTGFVKWTERGKEPKN